MNPETLAAFGSGYVPVMVFVCIIALVKAASIMEPRKRFAMIRAAGAIGIVHALQHIIAALQPGIMLSWWQNLGIDLLGFILVTAPPRFTAQAIIGACFGVMLFFDVMLGLAGDQFIRFHYLFSTIAGYVAFGTLFVWSFGVPPGAKDRMDRVGRWLSHMVRASLAKKPS